MLSFACVQAQESEAGLRVLGTKVAPTLQPREFSAVAHDSVHHESLLFGGTYGAQRYDDTWLLGESGWTVQSPKTHPAARISSSAAYDSLRRQFVLFGGRVQQAKPAMCSPGGVPQRLKSEFFCSDTWVFASGNWVKKTPAVSPTPREGHAMAFDAARNQVVLFGGSAGNSSVALNDTWLWDGNNWKLAAPAHRPPARLWHTMAYDPVHREVVLYGGDSGTQFLGDTWLWNGKDWQAARAQATPPGLRTKVGLDYETTTGKMVLFSGSVWSSHRTGSIALDSWSWDGSQWKKLAASSFQLISNFSKLTAVELKYALIANGSPSYLWLPLNKGRDID